LPPTSRVDAIGATSRRSGPRSPAAALVAVQCCGLLPSPFRSPDFGLESGDLKGEGGIGAGRRARSPG
jgi:hypothetical protein